ncbi:hypothetical protein ILUMI_10055 [Ignelater luminosus]|uniref:Uncharacterized protein n=1 Tax=Ignelater luminosus TaxID=2038154 RepID=A0A8K0D154_IGNLU|nr:hypothetical protein ILUMI_10055 [Ignelater luminosus]
MKTRFENENESSKKTGKKKETGRLKHRAIKQVIGEMKKCKNDIMAVRETNQKGKEMTECGNYIICNSEGENRLLGTEFIIHKKCKPAISMKANECKDDSQHLPKLGRPSVLSAELEQKLCKFVVEMQELGFGLTVKKIRSTAYELAKTENKQNQLSNISMASKCSIKAYASTASVSTVDQIIKRPVPSASNKQKRVMDSSAKCLIPVKEIYGVRSTLPKKKGRSKKITPKTSTSVPASSSANFCKWKRK